MAKRTTVVIHDDLDQSEGARTIKFGFEGKSYEIDLSPVHEEELRKALKKYLDVATEVRSAAYAAPAAGGRRKYGSGPKRPDTKPIRDWARANGYPDLSERGRIPNDIQAKYEAANPGR